MTTVYFDRNVYVEISELRNGLTKTDVEIIKKAVDTKQISILLSSALIAETTAILQKSSKDFLTNIKTVFSFVSKEKMAKQNDVLLLEDCLSFANLVPFQRTIPISKQGKSFIESPKINKIFLRITHNHSKAMQQGAKNINVAMLSYKKDLENAGKEIPVDFVEFWKQHSVETIKRLIEKIPEKERSLCKRHGIEKMLQIRSIRLYTVHLAWFFYSGLRGVHGNPRTLKANDFMDFIHTIEASSAEIFVTQESKNKANKIPYILNQITFKNFMIMNLKEFLIYLQSKNTFNLQKVIVA